jgi:hypothetical protein
MKFISSQNVSRFTALILGEAGIGKTSLIRTIPEGENVFVLSAEGGLLVVKDLVESGRVAGAEISSIADFEEALLALRDVEEYRRRFKWIFIDSLTEIADRCAAEKKAAFAGDGFKQWGEFTDVMMRLIKEFRDIEHYNVVFTCLPEYDKDELNRFYYAPMVPGKALKQRLTSYFDYVFYLRAFAGEDGSAYRAFQTVPTDKYPAKARCWYEGQLLPVERPNLGYVSARLSVQNAEELAES